MVAQSSSLAVGTKITMFDDKKIDIENLEVGDIILSFNIKDKVYEEKKVKSIKKIMYNRLVRVTLNSGIQLTMTSDCPFLAEKGWVSVDPELTKSNTKYTDVKRCQSGEFALFYNVTSTDYVEITVIQGIMEPTQTYIVELEGDGAIIANGFLVGQN
jgi:intein/homing endonuclease